MTPIRPICFTVTKMVIVEYFGEDETSLPGWYWRYDAANELNGPYSTQDYATRAAKKDAI